MFGQAERLQELKKLKALQTKRDSEKIIAFTSGKGGTGKTFISLNIAFALSKQNKKILFIDLDSNLSNANIMLNVVAKKTVYDLFTGRNLLHEIVEAYEPNLHFIFGESGKTNYPTPRPELINQLFLQLQQIEKNYDYIFLDTGAGANDEIFSFLTNADMNIIITSPEPTAVMDAYVIVKLLNSRQYTGRKMVIVNKCSSPAEGEATFNNLSAAAGHFLNEKLFTLGFVEYDQAVSKSIIAQELLIRKDSKSKASLQIIKISRGFDEFNHMANIHQAASLRR